MKRSRTNTNLVTGVLILLGSGLLIGAVLVGIKIWLDSEPGWGETSPNPRQGSHIAKGSKALDFELETLEGGVARVDDYIGIPLLINFWASWCGPCKEEMPLIQSFYKQNYGELVVLAINFDEKPPVVQEFVDELRLTFPVLLDPGGSVSSLYKVRAYPTSVFVDRDGNIQAIHIGSFNEELLVEYLREIGIGL